MNGGASNSKVVRTARDRLIDLHSSAYPKGVTWKKHDSGGPRPITATGKTGKGNAALKGWALSGFCVREPGSEQKSGSEGSTPPRVDTSSPSSGVDPSDPDFCLAPHAVSGGSGQKSGSEGSTPPRVDTSSPSSPCGCHKNIPPGGWCSNGRRVGQTAVPSR